MFVTVIKSRALRGEGPVPSKYGQKQSCIHALTKLEGKRQLGRPGQRWQEEIRWKGMEWVDLAQEKDKWRSLLNTEVNLGFPYNLGTFWTSSVLLAFKGDSASWTKS